MENELMQNGFEYSFNYAATWPEAAIINLVVYALTAWWLYNVNKKLGEPIPWLAWVPVLSIYSFVKAAWKSWIWILWIILWLIFFIIPWLIIIFILCNEISKRTWNWVWTTLWLFFLFPIFIAITWYRLDSKKIKEPKQVL